MTMYVDSRSMSLDVKVLFGKKCLVSAPSRNKAHWMAGYSPVTQCTLLKMVTSI